MASAPTKDVRDAERKEMFLRTCTHFNGVQHDACLAGQCYDALKQGDRVLPCAPVFADNAHGRSVATCEKFQQQTQRDLEERDAEFERAMERMRLVMPVVREWRNKPPRGKQTTIDCPTGCGCQLHLTQSSYNGHVHGHCSTAGCVSWME